MRVLFIINECNPEWSSVPLLAYHFYNAVSKLVDATLVTHERNKQALEKVRGERPVHYVAESRTARVYYKYLDRWVFSRWNNWPLHHVLSYPVYAEFNRRVFRRFKKDVLDGRYDIVHALTPMLPRYPVKIRKACSHKTPFVIGPVNGGLPFPSNFGGVAKKEAAHFNFLRYFSRFLPGYRESYQKANAVLAGSSYTQELIQALFDVHPPKLKLFFENGIPSEFLSRTKSKSARPETAPFNILFVGRLVPYKGADMILSALGSMAQNIKDRLTLTIVGDGPEKNNLKEQTTRLNIEKHVRFTGWVDHHETLEYYRSADLFCFPSVREFGGAVVLEAMAAGLPCIVVNHGGISEYVTNETGIKIDPVSRASIIQGLSAGVERLMNDSELYGKLSKNAALRAGEFEWGRKAEKLVAIYREALE